VGWWVLCKRGALVTFRKAPQVVMKSLDGVLAALWELITLPALVKTIFSSVLISLWSFAVCSYNVFLTDLICMIPVRIVITDVMSDERGRFQKGRTADAPARSWRGDANVPGTAGTLRGWKPQAPGLRRAQRYGVSSLHFSPSRETRNQK